MPLIALRHMPTAQGLAHESGQKFEHSQCSSMEFERNLLFVRSLQWNLSHNCLSVCLSVIQAFFRHGHIRIYRETSQGPCWRPQSLQAHEAVVAGLLLLLPLHAAITQVGGPNLSIRIMRDLRKGGKWGMLANHVKKQWGLQVVTSSKSYG